MMSLLSDDENTFEEVPAGESIDAHIEVGKVVVDDDVEYCVEKIVDYYVNKSKKDWFLIKWWGWSSHYNSWEPTENVTHAQEVVDAYFSQNPRKLIRRNVVEKYWEAKKKKQENHAKGVNEKSRKSDPKKSPPKQRKSASTRAWNYNSQAVTRMATQNKGQGQRSRSRTRCGCSECENPDTLANPQAKNDLRRKRAGEGVINNRKRNNDSNKCGGSQQIKPTSPPAESAAGSRSVKEYTSIYIEHPCVLTRTRRAEIYPKSKFLTSLESTPRGRSKKISDHSGAGNRNRGQSSRSVTCVASNSNGTGTVATSPRRNAQYSGVARAGGGSDQSPDTRSLENEDWLALGHSVRLRNVDWNRFSRPPAQWFHDWLHNGRLDDLHVHTCLRQGNQAGTAPPPPPPP